MKLLLGESVEYRLAGYLQGLGHDVPALTRLPCHWDAPLSRRPTALPDTAS